MANNKKSVEDNKKTMLAGLKEAPIQSKPNPSTGKKEPYMKQFQLNDDYKVILRKDVGDFNHGDADHWNFEIQTLGGNTKFDLHLYLGEDGNLIPFTNDNIYVDIKGPFKSIKQ